MTKKKTTKRGGFKLPGGIGPKGVIMGALGISLVPRLVPVPPAASKLVTGLAMRALNIGGGGALSAVGMMELVANYAAPLLGGFMGGTSLNGSTMRGYDY